MSGKPELPTTKASYSKAKSMVNLGTAPVTPSKEASALKPRSSTAKRSSTAQGQSSTVQTPFQAPTFSLNMRPSFQGTPVNEDFPPLFSQVAAGQPSSSQEPAQPFIEGYIVKPDTIETLTLEDHEKGQSLSEILSNHFPPGFHWATRCMRKDRVFYEFVLVDTDSILITHKADLKQPKRIAFSKLRILKVLTFKEWGQAPHTPKRFSQPFEPQVFDYQDYQDAWYNVLYHANFNHSWFVYWSDKKALGEVPNWFLSWFTTFGPVPNFLPPQSRQGWNLYKERVLGKSEAAKFLFFLSQNKIPWIMCWIYRFDSNPNSLLARDSHDTMVKVVKVKWWDKIPRDIACFSKVGDLLIKMGLTVPPPVHPQQDETQKTKQKLLASLEKAEDLSEIQRILSDATSAIAESISTSDEEVEYDPFQDSQFA